jgi:hypothetical protein
LLYIFLDGSTGAISGADPGFQVRGGAHLKKLRQAEGGAKMFGVFRVKNHDFTPKIGIVIDNKLTFNQHISEKINKANSIMGVLRRTMEYMDCTTFKLLYTALVRHI